MPTDRRTDETVAMSNYTYHGNTSLLIPQSYKTIIFEPLIVKVYKFIKMKPITYRPITFLESGLILDLNSTNEIHRAEFVPIQDLTFPSNSSSYPTSGNYFEQVVYHIPNFYKTIHQLIYR